jgi:hypothetical protein
MRLLLKQAQAEHYGIAAYNMIDYNSAVDHRGRGSA